MEREAMEVGVLVDMIVHHFLIMVVEVAVRLKLRQELLN
jgi:hypothetical protein